MIEDKSVSTYYTENIKLVHDVAVRVYRRALAVSPSLEYGDIFQELSVVFCRCYERFDASKGFKFSTFFMQAAYFEMNRFLEPYQRELKSMAPISLDRINHGDDEREGLHEFVDSHTPAVLDELTAIAALEELKGRMSPLEAKLVDLCVDPPEWLEREFKAHESHSAFARSRGHVASAQREINIKTVGRMLRKIGAPTAPIREAVSHILSMENANTK